MRITPLNVWIGRAAFGVILLVTPVAVRTAAACCIASLPLADPAGHLSAEVARRVLDPLDRIRERHVAAEGVPVVLTSASQSVRATTDEDGKLELQLPEGEYTVEPIVPDTLVVLGPQQLFLPARGCASASFALVANGRIEGRVVREDGTGVENVRVAVIPVDAPDNRPWEAAATHSTPTDPNGGLSVERVLPGSYYAGGNAVYGPRRDAPFAPTYFPDVSRKEESSVIEMSEGEHKDGFTIVVRPLAETTLSGVVISANGEPVAGAGVTTWPAGRRLHSVGTAVTDEDGAFRVPILAGIDYDVVVGRRMPTGFQTGEIVVHANQPIENLRITIAR